MDRVKFERRSRQQHGELVLTHFYLSYNKSYKVQQKGENTELSDLWHPVSFGAETKKLRDAHFQSVDYYHHDFSSYYHTYIIIKF